MRLLIAVITLLFGVSSFASLATVERLLSSSRDLKLEVCEAYQLTEKGFSAHIPHLSKHPNWNEKTLVRAIRNSFMRRKKDGPFGAATGNHKDRDSVEDFLNRKGSRTSFQTAKALMKLAIALHRNNMQTVSGVAVRAIANRIFQSRSEGIDSCINIKWGNKSADFHAIPLRTDTLTEVKRLFAEIRTISPLTSSQVSHLESMELLGTGKNSFSEDEIYELKALAYAATIYENQSVFLKLDKAGFDGNPVAPSGADGSENEFVCTDEMTTHSIWIRKLKSLGLLKHFELQPNFSHRVARLRLTGFKKPFTDHFGVLLRTKSKPHRFVVYDTWLRPGGDPAVISPLNLWEEKKEVDFFHHDLDEAGLASQQKKIMGLLTRPIIAAPDTRQVPGFTSGSSNYRFKFPRSLFGHWKMLRAKYPCGPLSGSCR